MQGSSTQEFPSDAERRLAASMAAHTSWANTEDRTARTAKARKAAEDKFLKMAGGDPARAKSLRSAHYKRMALASAKARRTAAEKRAASAGGGRS